MTRHDDARAGVRRDADGFLWISLWPEAAPNRIAGTRLEASSRPRSSVLTGLRSLGCCHRAQGRPRCAVPTRLGTLRRSVKEPGLPSPRTTLVRPPGCLWFGSATSAEYWCRVRRRAPCRLLGALMRVRHSCWREPRPGWAGRALRAARPVGARWGRDRCGARSGSSAVSVATATARCTASGVRVPEGVPALLPVVGLTPHVAAREPSARFRFSSRLLHKGSVRGG
jgi:hypothetical protein